MSWQDTHTWIFRRQYNFNFTYIIYKCSVCSARQKQIWVDGLLNDIIYLLTINGKNINTTQTCGEVIMQDIMQ